MILAIVRRKADLPVFCQKLKEGQSQFSALKPLGNNQQKKVWNGLYKWEELQ